MRFDADSFADLVVMRDIAVLFGSEGARTVVYAMRAFFSGSAYADVSAQVSMRSSSDVGQQGLPGMLDTKRRGV